MSPARRTSLESERVAAALPADAARVRVAFSGGMDSSVLLHLLAHGPLAGRLEAMHVHHGLHPDADRWAARCRSACLELGVPFRLERVDVPRNGGGGPEAAARRSRYRVLADGLAAGDVVVTAHHADDQAETVLLRLLRGAGPRGLAAMAPCAPLPGRAAIRLARPLLGVRRAAIEAYARAAGLRWIDDPANTSAAFDRSYLRQAVMPALRARWPGMIETLGRGAALSAEAAVILGEVADADLAQALRADDGVSVPALMRLSSSRRRNAVRGWIARRGLPPPAAVHLAEMETAMLDAGADTGPCVAWPGAEWRRYRDAAYVTKPLPPPPSAQYELHWDGVSVLNLPPGCGRLQPDRAGAPGPAATARFRRGGERLRSHSEGPSRPVKKLFQEAGVPPWVRERAPFLYHGDRLVNVAGRWVDAAYAGTVVWTHELPGDPAIRGDHEHSGPTG